MRNFIIKRLLLSVLILFCVTFIIYALLRCLPTSYVEKMAMQLASAPGSKPYEEWVAFAERYRKEQQERKPTEPWQLETIRKAKEAGISDGSRPLDNMTRVEGMAMVLAGKE